MQWKEQLTMFHTEHKCLCATFDFFPISSVRTTAKRDYLKQAVREKRTWSDNNFMRTGPTKFGSVRLPILNLNKTIFTSETHQLDPGLIFHSDRGSQYTSHRFLQLLHEHGMIQSFSNSGRPHDHAVAESFFALFKKEELYRKNYSSEKEFKQGVDSYITFSNQQRPHRTLKNKTPEQVEIEFTPQQPDM